MTIIRTTFDRSNELYVRLFGDWLHINFLIRTALLILLLWLVVYVAAQLLRYVFVPLWLLFYYNVIFRAWNYLFVETPQEWIYIRYNSKDKPKFNQLYLRLCDKVKRNRTKLSNLKYTGLIRHTKKFTIRFMIICGIVSALWVASFGLHQEYAIPAAGMGAIVPTGTAADESVPGGEYVPTLADTTVADSEEPVQPGHMATDWLNPATWPVEYDIVLALNQQGAQGAFLRNGPGIAGYSVIEILWDNDQLVYLHSFEPDPYVAGLYWLYVLSPTGTDGFVSSQLVYVVD